MTELQFICVGWLRQINKNIIVPFPVCRRVQYTYYVRIRVQYCVHIHIHTYRNPLGSITAQRTQRRTCTVSTCNKDLKSKINDKIFLVELLLLQYYRYMYMCTCTVYYMYWLCSKLILQALHVYIPVALVSCIQLFMCVHVLCTQHYSYNFGLYLDTCVHTHTHTLMSCTCTYIYSCMYVL